MPTSAAIAREIAGFVARNYPQPPGPQMVPMMVEAWRDDLAELTDADLATACQAYRRSTDPADRWWPTPGRIRALAPAGQAAALLLGEGDAEAAFPEFMTRMSALAFRPDRDDTNRHLDPVDPYRNDAMFAGLAAVGGARAWAVSEVGNPATLGSLRKSWIAAYRDVRRIQARDPGALQLTASAQHKRIGVAS